MAEKLIAENRRARYDYQLLDRFEAGLVLTGTEVKSLRNGRATLAQAWADVRDGEAWLQGAEIAVYDQGNRADSEEHTSELQSRFDLVCRLLLEKKKKKKAR